MRRLTHPIWICLGILLVAACNPFKPAERKMPEGEVPESFSLYTEAPADTESHWWYQFSAPDLDNLVETALTDNFSIKEAWARLKQVEARAVQAGAELYPNLTGEAGANYGRQRSTEPNTSTRNLEDYSIGLVSRYEVDLWGRIRSEHEAAVIEANATREDINAAAISLAAEVSLRWSGIISQRMQKALLESQLKTNRTVLKLIELRFRMAMVSALDVYQQKQVVEATRAEIPLVEAQERRLLNELAVLVGKPPGAELGITSPSLPEPVGIPEVGLPADLLAARPDIRATGMRLTAADWQVAAARANRLPSITLTARARYGEGDLENIFNNWLLTLAGNLSAPILDGGFRAAEVDRSRAIADERLWAYQRTVLTAVKEVEDALVTESKQREHIATLVEVTETARQALREAIIRYRNGLNDYLPVLTQILAVQDLERNLIRQQRNLLDARIGLYRALGGNWPDQIENPYREKNESDIARSEGK